MKIEIEISDNEINFIKRYLDEQGRDIYIEDVKNAIKSYVYGSIEDSQESRVDTVVEALMEDSN